MSSKKKKKKNVCTLILGAIFVRSKHIQRFAKRFRKFCQNFHRFCPDFQRFYPDFHQIKSFGGAVEPPSPTRVLSKIRVISCFIFNFILRSCLFTRIGIVISTARKDFLHRALLFGLWVVKLYFCCNKWTNGFHTVNSARPGGLAKYYQWS